MCKMERWRDVVGYEGLYRVSDLGRVRSVDRAVRGGYGEPKKLVGKVRRLSQNSISGYLFTSLCKEGKQRVVSVHRLVLAAFVGPCPDGLEVRHGPNGVVDNSVGNLSYGTKSQNSLDRRRDGTDNGTESFIVESSNLTEEVSARK